MPYYLYRVIPSGPIHRLIKIGQFDAFRDASQEAKRLRHDVDPGTGETIRSIFAANELQAEDLLNQPRVEVPVTGED